MALLMLSRALESGAFGGINADESSVEPFHPSYQLAEPLDEPWTLLGSATAGGYQPAAAYLSGSDYSTDATTLSEQPRCLDTLLNEQHGRLRSSSTASTARLGQRKPRRCGWYFGGLLGVTETANAYTVLAEASGFTAQDITVRVNDGVLSVSGQHDDVVEQQDENGKVVVSESSVHMFCRSLALPQNIDEHGATATLKQGILTVEVPRVAAGTSKSRTQSQFIPVHSIFNVDQSGQSSRESSHFSTPVSSPRWNL